MPATSQPQNTSAPRIAFAAGWTAGHVMPAVTLAEAWRERFQDSPVPHFFTGNFPWESELLDSRGFSVTAIDVLPWKNRSPIQKLRCLSRLPRNIRAARKILETLRPDLVFCCGGFVSLPPALAARRLGIPIAIFEPNAVFGAANRRLLSSASLVVTSSLTPPFPGTAPTVSAGIPIARPLAEAASGLRIQFPAGNESVRLLVNAGSHGSAFLNHHAPILAAGLDSGGTKPQVTHLSGRDTNPAPILAAYSAQGIPADVMPYHDHIVEAYRHTHFALATAGANTLHELAAFGIPSLIIPLADSADDHQSANARVFSDLTATPVISEAACQRDPQAATERIADVLQNPDRWKFASERLRTFPDLDAASHILDAVVRVIEQRQPSATTTA